MTPPAFNRVVKTCLAKDPEDRWQSAHDIAEELLWISERGSQAGVAAPIVRKRIFRERTAWGLLAAMTLAAAAFATGFFLRAPKPSRMTRSQK